MLAPEQVFLFVQQIAERLKTITLDQSEYLEAARALSDRGIAGAGIYDGVLLACARKSGAETIYTWNEKQFANWRPISPT